MYEPKLIFVCKPLYTRTPSVPNRTNLSDLVTSWNTTKAISRAREDSVLNFDFHRQRSVQKWIVVPFPKRYLDFKKILTCSRELFRTADLITRKPVKERFSARRAVATWKTFSKHFSLGSWPPQVPVSIAKACHGVHSQHFPHHHGEGVLANQWGKCTT